ncbi:MAG: cobyric acid synthase [Synergistetes bacterium]|nr:cobyric acid synthase [Synergistota bacterium]
MAKSLMICGTSSGVGKTLIVAALCRIFANKGINVAPFKAQNMSLNSGVTPEGEEIARAQIIQAIASRKAPSVLMNPVLLKPEGEAKSQVIVNGEVFGSIQAKDYYERRKILWEYVKNAYDKLSSSCDLVIIEGAGSPAEINLKGRDIVNMAMARYANASVLLVGDIERGGVFASLYGTVMLLDEEERNMIKGFIINKFRGDRSILDPGLGKLYSLTGIPTIGVIPYVRHNIDEEDILSERLLKRKRCFTCSGDAVVNIVVLKLRYTSNYTDFMPLELEEDVNLFYVLPEDLLDINVGEIDALIIPGSKNTMADLLHLKSLGINSYLRKLLQEGKVVVGICGGYQMLGKRILDPYGVEAGGEVEGFGLLNIETFMKTEKTLTLVKGRLSLKEGVSVMGYEIHMGETKVLSGIHPLFILLEKNGKPVREGDGVSCDKSLSVWGTYIHGLFDSGGFRRFFVNMLRERKGLPPILSKESPSWLEITDAEIESFSHVVQKSIDISFIEKLCGF